jgi:transposase
MILDNSKIHHAKLLQPFLQDYKDRLQLVFLPPYSLKLNLIEGLWGWLKSETINNVFYKNGQQIKLAVRKFIESINKIPERVINRLCVRM